MDRRRSTRTTSTRTYDAGAGRRPTSPPRRAPRSCSPRCRAPYRGRSTPVNAWWGSFDLAVSLFSGAPARAAVATTSSCATRWTPQEVAVGWWPGDARYPQGGVLRLRAPGAARASRRRRSRRPPRAGTATLGEYVLDWDDVRAAADPHATALQFARSAFQHACAVCSWDPALAASAEGTPPPGHLTRRRARRIAVRTRQAGWPQSRLRLPRRPAWSWAEPGDDLAVRADRNFSKFHWMSPALPSPSGSSVSSV